jgi:hypothetical protein
VIGETLKSADDRVTDESGYNVKHYACKYGSSAVIEAVYTACSKNPGQELNEKKYSTIR